MSVDLDRIKNDFSVSSVVGQFINLRKEGTELVGLCPFHQDKDPSLHVIDHKKFWTCMACDANGDVLDFVMKFNNVPLPEAAAIITGEKSAPSNYSPPVPVSTKPDKVDNIVALIPPPEGASDLFIGKNKVQFYQHRQDKTVERSPAAVYTYRSGDGALLGYVIRTEWEADGKRRKITPMVTFCDLGEGRKAWTDRAFPSPRPLFGLEHLAMKPGVPVFVVEGEKAATALAILLPDNPVLTWPGGTNAVDKAEWSALSGRKVVFWPDADQQKFSDSHSLAGQLKPLEEQPGTKAMLLAASLLQRIAVPIVLRPPEDVSAGWDAADAADEWGLEKTSAWLKLGIKEAYERSLPPIPEMPDDQPPAHTNAPESGDQMTEDSGGEEQEAYTGFPDPFRILGHDRGTFFYLPSGSRQVVELSAASHTKLNMFQLASPDYWESRYPKKNGDADYDLAAAALMKQAFGAGVFNRSRRRRGRGAWVDRERNVYHLGDFLWVDGKSVEIDEFDTKFVYEQADSMEINLDQALSNAEAHKTLEIALEFSWGSSLSAYLLSGWCVIAPVCGVLDWRPHFWLSGPSGSGKSTIMRDFVSALVGSTAFIAEGSTTEAAIRQSLDGDARPVVFDEAEPKDTMAMGRLRAVLDLARVSASESGGEIVKGGNNHQAKVFKVRSCFGFASVNPAVEFYADETRITRLHLLKPRQGDEEAAVMRQAAWEELSEYLAATMTEDYSNRMLGRTVRNLAVLRANSKTFSKAAATLFKSARHGQQYGPMLAGAYLLHSTGQIEYSKALDWLRDRDFSDIISVSQEDGDEARCLSHIMQSRIHATIRQGRNEEHTVAELLEFVLECGDDEEIAKNAEVYLRRNGLKTEDGGLWVSNQHSALKRMFTSTPWQAGWRETLSGAAGTKPSQSAIYFSRGDRNRAIWLPSPLV